MLKKLFARQHRAIDVPPPLPLDVLSLTEVLAGAIRDISERGRSPIGISRKVADLLLSLAVADAMAWCRWLNAYPLLDSGLSVGGVRAHYRGWTQTADDWFVFVDDTGRGRSGRILPAEIDPELVPRSSVNEDAAPGRDRLRACVNSIEIAVAHGWEVAGADAVIESARRVLDREGTLHEYGEGYQAVCAHAGRWIFEGVTGERLLGDERALAECVGRADQAMDRLALDAAQAYAEFRTDAPTFAHACLALDLWGCIASQDDYRPLIELSNALSAAVQAERPENAVLSLAQSLLVGACLSVSENALEALIDRIEQKTEELQARALAVDPPSYTSFCDSLYRTAARTTSCLKLIQVMQLVDQNPTEEQLTRPGWDDEFRRRVKASGRLAEERLVRISDALWFDAEDILGLRIETARSEIGSTRAHDGEAAARLSALGRTTHTLNFPRAVEPYLLGAVDHVAWKRSISEWSRQAYLR